MSPFLSVIMALSFVSLGFTFCLSSSVLFVYRGILINILTTCGIAIMILVLNYWCICVAFLIFTMGMWCYWSIRSIIPLSIALLKIFLLVKKQIPQMLQASLISSLVGILISNTVSLTIVVTYIKNGRVLSDTNREDLSCLKSFGILVGMFFCGFYISEVMKDVIYWTVCRIFFCRSYTSRSKYKNQRTCNRFLEENYDTFDWIDLLWIFVYIIETLGQSQRLVRGLTIWPWSSMLRIYRIICF